MDRETGYFTASEKDVAAGGFQQPCEEVEKGGLTGAIRSDDGMNGPLFNGKADIQDGCQGAELPGQIMCFENSISQDPNS